MLFQHFVLWFPIFLFHSIEIISLLIGSMMNQANINQKIKFQEFVYYCVCCYYCSHINAQINLLSLPINLSDLMARHWRGIGDAPFSNPPMQTNSICQSSNETKFNWIILHMAFRCEMHCNQSDKRMTFYYQFAYSQSHWQMCVFAIQPWFSLPFKIKFASIWCPSRWTCAFMWLCGF